MLFIDYVVTVYDLGHPVRSASFPLIATTCPTVIGFVLFPLLM